MYDHTSRVLGSSCRAVNPQPLGSTEARRAARIFFFDPRTEVVSRVSNHISLAPCTPNVDGRACGLWASCRESTACYVCWPAVNGVVVIVYSFQI